MANPVQPKAIDEGFVRADFRSTYQKNDFQLFGNLTKNQKRLAIFAVIAAVVAAAGGAYLLSQAKFNDLNLKFDAENLAGNTDLLTLVGESALTLVGVGGSIAAVYATVKRLKQIKANRQNDARAEASHNASENTKYLNHIHTNGYRQGQTEGAQKESAVAQKTITDLGIQLETERKAGEALVNKTDTLEKALIKERQENDGLVNKLNLAEKELGENRLTLSGAQNTFAQMENEIALLKAGITSAQNSLKTANDTRGQVEQQVTQLQGQLKQAQNETQQARQETQTVKSEADRKAQQLQSSLDERIREVQEARDTARQVQKDLVDARTPGATPSDDSTPSAAAGSSPNANHTGIEEMATCIFNFNDNENLRSSAYKFQRNMHS